LKAVEIDRESQVKRGGGEESFSWLATAGLATPKLFPRGLDAAQ
jgi:hypothetical protein